MRSAHNVSALATPILLLAWKGRVESAVSPHGPHGVLSRVGRKLFLLSKPTSARFSNAAGKLR